MAFRWAWIGGGSAFLVGCTGPSDPECPICETAVDTDTDTDTDVSPVGVVTPLSNPVDECRELCVRIEVEPALSGIPFRLESDRDGFVAGGEGVLAVDGRAEVCVTERLTPGEHQFAAHFSESSLPTAFASVTVAPFGFAYGLTREPVASETELWIPEVSVESEPVLLPTAESWDSLSVMMPSSVVFGDTRFLYYAGTDDVEFSLGIATASASDLVFEKYAGNPILQADPEDETSWKRFAQNTPHGMVVGDEVWMYYNGRGQENGGLAIGLAKSSDGFTFTDIDENPVLAPTGVDTEFDGKGVAHPSVLLRDGVFEMWYASGTLEIGYALSADGVAFERYCENPVFSGQENGWDQATVKAPEVVFDGVGYWMTYSGCGRGCYEVGWGYSTDGSHWAVADAPIIPVLPESSWYHSATQSTYLERSDSEWLFWVTGTGSGHAQIGLGRALAQ